MSRASLLLRLLLILCLVFTTTAGAVASMHMHAPMQPMPHAVAMAHAQPAPPCHESAASDEHAVAGVEAAAAHEGDPADCCQAGQCDSICLLSLPPLPGGLALAATPIRIERLRTEPDLDRLAPRLPRPQRPPIA